jgi:hypothetical protein
MACNDEDKSDKCFMVIINRRYPRPEPSELLSSTDGKLYRTLLEINAISDHEVGLELDSLNNTLHHTTNDVTLVLRGASLGKFVKSI